MKRIFAHLVLIIVLTGSQGMAVVSALSPEQKKVYRSGIGYFDVADCGEACSCGGAGASAGDTQLYGSENAEIVFNFFVSKGYKPFQAAGIIGNMSVESGVEPQRLQGTQSGIKTPAESVSGNIGWGLVQWTPASKFINTQSPKSKANEIGVQLEFLWNQLEGKGPLPEKQAGDQLKTTTNVEDAVLAFQGNTKVGGKYSGFERPADQRGSVSERTSRAKAALAKFGSGVVTDAAEPGSTVCTVSNEGGAGEVVGEYAFPVPKKFYTQHPEWFSAPHHDYPASDIPVPTGTPVYSMTGGRIIKAPAGGACGIGVIIDSGGVQYTYCHGSDGGAVSGAKQGDTVKAGQLIMHSASTGESSGPHLHIEIETNGGQNRCPQELLVGIAKGSPVDAKSLPTSGCSYKGKR